MAAATVTLGAVMLEARPFRPFKSSEEYLWAMKEDLAEWLTVLYPDLRITADNFLDRLDTGVALCKHANAVRESARVLLEGSEAGTAEPEEAVTLARALRARPPVTLLPAARPGTFFARDNVSNFIDWCRKALSILECLLFETDDLCLRKNEKHVVLCLLEVARRGAVLGMPAPLLVQMEKQIERELAGEESPPEQSVLGLVPLGPQPQLVTNDLRSLDERVRDLVERCSCPTQFPMVRVSEGKYRIGDTKILIFVRILRAHVMVRVGGGWDTLAHYLDKHDPCRCRAQHRATLAARLSRPRPGLSGATVTYERAPLSLGCGGAPPAGEDAGDEAAASLPYMPDWTLHDSGASCGSPERARRGGSGARGSPCAAATAASPGRLSLSPERRGRPAPSPQHRARSPRAASPGSGGGGGGGGVGGGESASDNGSEVSDEGYRSLGLAPSAQGSPPALGPNSHSLTPADDADYTERVAREESAAREGGGEDVSLVTGLRKTGYSAIYGGAPASAPATPPTSALHSPDTPSAHSTPSHHAPTQNLHPRQSSRIPHSPVRKPASRSSTPSPKHAPNPQASPKTHRPPPASRNTWSGRSGPGGRAKSRPALGADTFDSPRKVQAKVTDRPQEQRVQEPFRRNTPLRSSSASLRAPPQKPLSPLLETILRSAETAKDDAAVLQRMKDIIRQFSRGEGARGELSRSNSRESTGAGGGGGGGGGAGSGVEWAEWTRAWVMSSGRLERSASSRQLSAPPPATCAPPSAVCARPRAQPRADARATPSRIPAPLPHAYRRSASTTNFP